MLSMEIPSDTQRECIRIETVVATSRARGAFLSLALAWVCHPPTALPGTEADSLATSAQRVLSENCVACHGAARMSDLDVRSSEGLLKGGKRGPAIVPGSASDSLLLSAVQGKGELKMPPGDAALDPSKIGLLGKWIDAGAPWPTDAKVSDEPSWWSFRKPERPAVPEPKDKSWVRNPIDTFILAKLNEQGLEPVEPADRWTLVRRAYFDLHGLPPTPEQVGEFVNDPSNDAYAKLIDRLLESERYGERWGRYWLDLVRYADTSGFETDHFYTTAWRYRDYVIESFNEDKPYTTFVQEQIAADEIWSTDMDLEGTLHLPEEKKINVKRRIGTSLFTLGAFPVEYTYYGDLYRAEWSAEAVDLIGSAFLGLTVKCARCHDHKSDPIGQRDYYRLAAFFAGSAEREIPLVSLFDMQSNTRSFPLLEQTRILKRMAKRAKAKGEERAEQMRRLGEAYMRAPERYPTAKVLAHEESVPDTHVLIRGDFKRKGEAVEPGFPAVLNTGPPIDEPEGRTFIPQRRKALALWLTSPDQPLLGRVMINRIWQHHFGQGIVGTPSDFGRHGEPPTHPKLLDWLAVEFAERGWSIKQMHRLIMLSRTYQMSSVANASGLEKDPDNLSLSRVNRRRLDADALRDTILAVAGTLNLKMGGVGVIPPLTSEEILAARMPHLWPENPDPAEHTRRSVYLQVKRSLTLPMLQIFDAPDTATSCARREVSTVAPQALALMNSPFTAQQAEAFASRIHDMAGGDSEQSVEIGWHLAFGRSPTGKERQTALDYLERNSLKQFCLLLFNMSEFVYVD